MKHTTYMHTLTAQERVGIHGGTGFILLPETIAFLQSISPEYIQQLIKELLSPSPPSQFPQDKVELF